MWPGIVDSYLIGSYLMPSPLSGGEIYETVRREVLPEMVQDVPLGIRLRMWFQRDGAPTHKFLHRNARQCPNAFSNRWIRCNGPVWHGLRGLQICLL